MLLLKPLTAVIKTLYEMNLHFTMLLLKPTKKPTGMSVQRKFTFHYASIKTSLEEAVDYAKKQIYISLCFY